MSADAEPERFTQWICETQPGCLCVAEPNDGKECCCRETPDGVCGECNTPLVEIYFDTGEPVARPKP